MLNVQRKHAYCLDYKDEHGRRRQIRTNACTKKDAERELRSILDRMDKAKALGITPEAMRKDTFATFVDEVFLPAKENRVKASTHRLYSITCERLKEYFGNMTLASIRAETIDAYLKKSRSETTCRGGPPSGAVLIQRRARLLEILEMAVKRDIIIKNYAKCVDRPKYKPQERHLITPDEENRLIEAAPAWLKPMIIVGLYGGMRVSEIAVMTWSNINDGWIHIPDSKNGEKRDVPINSEIRAALASLDRPTQDGKPVEWVFPNKSRKWHRHSQAVSNTFTSLAKKLGIPVTFHCTRHTCITRLRLLKNVPDPLIMKISGHKSLKMLDVYTHVQPVDLRGVTEGLGMPKDANQMQDRATKGTSAAQLIGSQAVSFGGGNE
jgi:integrase